MKLRRRSKRFAAGTTVALATAGLSSCNDNGAVDPPPPPLECNSLDRSQTFSATATLAGRSLQVTVRRTGEGFLASAVVPTVVGGTLALLSQSEPIGVSITLADDSVTSGSFVLITRIETRGGTCDVSRTFQFSIQGGNVVIAGAQELPLPARQQARIGVVEREGNDVVLEATTPFGGPQTVSWSVSGGEMVASEGSRLRWRLPSEPGLYQAELVIDYGERGLSFDTLALEVS